MFGLLKNRSKNILVVTQDGALGGYITGLLLELGFSVEIANDPETVRKKSWFANLVIFVRDNCLSPESFFKAIRVSRKDFLVVSKDTSKELVLEAHRFGAKDFILIPQNYREFILHIQAVLQKKARITCIGGGTGLFTVLMGLKSLPKVLITSIVNMSDDGGSSGRLRSSFGVLPPGDVRRSLVAFSNAPLLMNQVLQYRFQKGGDELSGHNFGNLFLAALSEIKGSMSEAVKAMGDILNIQGIVLPVTEKETSLCAEFVDGRVVRGESKIDLCEDRSPDLKIKKVWHEPLISCDTSVYAAIYNSDLLIIGPGDLYTSIITNLLIKDVCEAIKGTSAKKVYLANIMTKPGETSGYDAKEHIKEVNHYLGGDYLDYLIISNTRLSDRGVYEYSKKNQFPVAPGNAQALREVTKARAIFADVGHEEELVRHDSQKIKQEISKLLVENKMI